MASREAGDARLRVSSSPSALRATACELTGKNGWVNGVVPAREVLEVGPTFWLFFPRMAGSIFSLFSLLLKEKSSTRWNAFFCGSVAMGETRLTRIDFV